MESVSIKYGVAYSMHMHARQRQDHVSELFLPQSTESTMSYAVKIRGQ